MRDLALLFLHLLATVARLAAGLCGRRAQPLTGLPIGPGSAQLIRSRRLGFRWSIRCREGMVVHHVEGR
jgi:hypothetical protein